MKNPISSLLTYILIIPLHLYRWLISPLIPPRCRFAPTCSEYSIEALRTWGLIKGSKLALKRISSCHPWSKKHGYDPVPKKNSSPPPSSPPNKN